MGGPSELFLLCLLVSVTSGQRLKLLFSIDHPVTWLGTLLSFFGLLRLSSQSHAVHSQSLWKPIPFLDLTNASL